MQGPQAASVALRPDTTASDSLANISRGSDKDHDGIPDSKERPYNPSVQTTQHTGAAPSFTQPIAPGYDRTSGFSMDPPASQGSYTAQASSLGEPALMPPTLVLPTQVGQAPTMQPQSTTHASKHP